MKTSDTTRSPPSSDVLSLQSRYAFIAPVCSSNRIYKHRRENMGKLTRDVISDLWPLYVSGEASSDTRALIEAFLQEDPEFARTLTTLERERFPSLEAPSLPPDHELK